MRQAGTIPTKQDAERFADYLLTLGIATKVEGNELHPASLGSSSARVQAAILDLYDPDRSQTVLKRGEASSFADFAAAWRERAKLHAAFAEWLHERVGEELLEIRAYHLDQASLLHAELDGKPPVELAHETAAALEAAGNRRCR